MSFVENGGINPPADPPADFSSGSSSGEEPVRMTLTGSRRAVDRMIHLLHKGNIVAGCDWSRPISIKNSNEIIRVASRMIKID